MQGAPDPSDYYREIYARGVAGEKPRIPVGLEELELHAIEAMEPRAAAYVAAGAGTEDTMRENLEAFRRWRIVPRMLRDVAERELSVTVLGSELRAPVLLAPIGVHTIVHPEGELATARAAANVGLPLIVSTAAAHTLEEIAEAGGEGERWYQLYWPNDPEIAQSIVRRADAAGYGALVVTLDTFIPGWKPRDLQEAWLPFLEGVGNANFLQDPVFRAQLDKSPEEDLGAAIGDVKDGKAATRAGAHFDVRIGNGHVKDVPFCISRRHEDERGEQGQEGPDAHRCQFSGASKGLLKYWAPRSAHSATSLSSAPER